MFQCTSMFHQPTLLLIFSSRSISHGQQLRVLAYGTSKLHYSHAALRISVTNNCIIRFILNKSMNSSRRNTVHLSFIFTAPVDCLQYFTSPSGRISSFNWKDVPVTAVRQLNNQNYNACFRTELIDRQVTILLIRNFPFFTD